MTFNPNLNPTAATSLDALAVGRTSSSPFLTVFQTRAPTSTDVSYPIQTRWVNTSNPAAANEWILVSYSNSTGQLTANWFPLGSTSVSTITLTGNSGGAVGVDGANNIFTIGDSTTITIVGNPGANTLTASTTGLIATQYDEDVGTAAPSGGVLQVLGGTGINTAGAGNTITINADAAVPLQFDGNTGTATAALNVLNILGNGDIVTAAAGNTVLISPGPSLATQYDEDAGSAVPALGVLNIVGGVGISTSGAGNTVTITNTASTSIQFDEDSGSAVPAAGIINVIGGTGIATSGAGNTITIMQTPIPVAGFLATYSASVPNVTGNGVLYSAIFDTEIFDTLGDYNNATGIFTAPDNGVYSFTAVINFSNIAPTNDSFNFDLVKNGTTSIHGWSGGAAATCDTAGSLTSIAAIIINMTAGDTMQVQTRITGGPQTVGIEAGAYPTFYQNSFSGALLHKT